MRRFITAAALSLATALAPLCASADTEPTVAAVYAVPRGVTFPRFEHTAPPRPRVPALMLVYVLQAYDAVQTSIALRAHNRYEQNGSMRPFSHGGLPTIALGFALGDLTRARLLRHAPEEVSESANAAQALANLDGILNTRRTLRAP
ncbi:MAG: hypothetical protein JOZ86_05420 [Candidatus Eremiobacteraeota bacterium]|nr:hypothetical protein [Candidatus Eremiobacteraeota bacterium]